MKSYYDEYANHCIRFYAKYPEPPEFRTDVDRRNWHAVNNAVSEYTEEQKRVIFSAVCGSLAVGQNIAEIETHGIFTQEQIWKLLCDTEHKIAKECGLIAE